MELLGQRGSLLRNDVCRANKWQKGNSPPVFTKGIVGECGNCRAVSVSFILGKVMRQLLWERETLLRPLEMRQVTGNGEYGL